MEDLIEEDPFLCPECAKVGYCIEARKNRISVTEKENLIEDEDTSILKELIEIDNEIMEEELVEEN